MSQALASLMISVLRPQPASTLAPPSNDDGGHFGVDNLFDVRFIFWFKHEFHIDNRIYDLEKSREFLDEDVILSGSTKLPLDVDEQLFGDIINWWLKCLKEITDTLSDAQWHVHIDDVDLEW